MQRFYVFLFLIVPILLRAQGLSFAHLSWTEALELAKKDNKAVFLDAYTVWCGPCKLMVSQTFTDSAVGAFFNQKFVNLKVDMEHGEGVLLAKKFKVSVFPTLLFFDAEGNVLHRASGFHGASDFLKLGVRALDKRKNTSALEKMYAAGVRDPGFLRELLELKSAAADPEVAKIAQQYLKTQEDYSTPENMAFIMKYADDPYSDAFYYLIHHKAQFEAMYTPEKVKDRLDQIFENYIQTYPNLQLGEVQRLYGTVYPEQGALLASSFRLTYYRKRNDMARFAESAIDHYQRYPSQDPDELNEIAAIFAEGVEDPELLKKALEWSKLSIRLQENYYAYETLASLYVKLKERKLALKAAKRAVELADQNDEEAAVAKQLLKELE